MKRLSPVDAAFLRMDSTRTAMHVGSMMTFRLPADAPADFLKNLVAQMRDHPFMPAPFSCKLAQDRKSQLLPAWVDAEIDTEYHVRHSALPYPGGERELGSLVARLHSNPMDFSRPLWEAHVIEGLENRRFALYFKAHHCAIDGMGAMSMVRQWLSDDPDNREPPGQMAIPKRDRAERQRLTRIFVQALSETGDRAKGMTQLVGKLMKMSRGRDSTVRVSMATPKTIFNAPISQQRRLGTQLLELARFKAISKKTNTTVNDVTLAVCGGAVRRYLLDHNALPEDSVTASVPVGLPRGDKGGNAVAGFVAPLCTDIADPARRVQRIHEVTTRSKEDLLSMSPSALEQFTLMGLSPLIIGQMTGTLAKMPPFFNFVVSNVVLTKHKLYLMGAELEAMYPMSILFDGYALNVTVIGYAEHVAIGFTGCRDAIPHLQRMAVYCSDALAELEEAVGLGNKKLPARKRSSVRKKPLAAGKA